MKRKKIAIVYPYVAHYRAPVFQLMVGIGSDSGSNYSYDLFSDVEADIPSLAVVDPALSRDQVSGWRWNILKNTWFRKLLLWQSGLFSQVAFAREYDAVVFLGNAYYISTWLASIVLRLRGRKVVFWTHGVRVPDAGIKRAIRKAFYSLAHGLFLYGERAKSFLKKEGFPENRLFVIYNSLDYEKQKRIRNSCQALKSGSKNSINLIYTGRLIASKKLDLIVDAVSLIRDRGVNAQLTVVGGGDAEADLRNKVKHLCLDDAVNFTGPCYDEHKLAQLYMAADVCVVPSAAGLTVMHALAFGVPVITDDDFTKHGPEVEAVVEGETGSYYKKGDVDDLVDKVGWWVEKLNKDGRSHCRDLCVRMVEESYTPDAQLKHIQSALDMIFCRGSK